MKSITAPITNYLDKQLSGYLMKKARTQRPGAGIHDAYSNRNLAPSLGLAYWLESEVSVFSDSVLTLKQEMFRNGFYWKLIDEEAETQPDKAEIERFESQTRSFIHKANYNNQSLQEVLSDFEHNLNVADNAYLMVIQSYEYTRSGEILETLVKEILSIDPRDIKKMVQSDGRLGGDVWVCPTHRDQQKGQSGYKCPICGALLQQAYYETTSTENKQYYLKDEVLHSSKFYPSILYGYPPILKIIDDAMAYHYLEKRTKAYYERGRPPGIMMVPTSNQESLRKFWNEEGEKMQADPHHVPLIGYVTEGRSAAEYVRMLHDPNPEMLAVKKELRERISSRFGVSLIFQNDTSTSGGLNNEGLQITVTGRPIEDGQRIYNEKVFVWLGERFGLEKWVLQVNPSEEDDEMAELEREARRIANARQMLEMGFDVDYTDGVFSFSGEAKPPMQMGGFPQMEAPPIDKAFNDDYLVKDFAQDAINAIGKGALYSFYEGVSDNNVDKIHGIIKDAFVANDLNLDKMAEAIAQATGLDLGRAEMIARTETSAVSMKAREIGWKNLEEERGEVFKFRTSEANDQRMSETSKLIAQKVSQEGGAVTLDRLREIYKEVSTRPVSQGGMGPSWTGWENFVGHPNERSSIVRVN